MSIILYAKGGRFFQGLTYKVIWYCESLLENSLKDQWPFWNIHISNSTPCRLYANDGPEVSNRDSGIVAIILRVEIFNYEKFNFWSKSYENSLEDQWPFWELLITIQLQIIF